MSVAVTDAQMIKEKKEVVVSVEAEKEKVVETMDEDGKRVYSMKTMRDQYGNYPVWMNKRRIAKHKKGRGKSLKSTTKPNKRLTRKQKKTINTTKTSTTASTTTTTTTAADEADK